MLRNLNHYNYAGTKSRTSHHWFPERLLRDLEKEFSIIFIVRAEMGPLSLKQRLKLFPGQHRNNVQ